MARGEAHWVYDPRIVRNSRGCIVPPVEAMPDMAAVTEGHPLLEENRLGPKQQLDRPLHSVNAINIPHDHGGAAVRIVMEGEIDRRHAHPVVRNRKVELNAKSRPGPAIAHSRLLDGGV